MELTTHQNKVLEQIKAFIKSDASVFILRGYAGTGKTTMVKVVADYVSQAHQVELMAPTGRAARILAAKTGYKATTIHRAIYDCPSVENKTGQNIAESEYKFIFKIRDSEYGRKSVAIVDEASMVCSRKKEQELFVFGTGNLLQDLLTYVRPDFGGKVIFVGDPAQLPPVGETVSNALCPEYFQKLDLRVSEAELTEVLRQNEDSVILKNAMMIRDLLQNEKRNRLVFEKQKDAVEFVAPEHFLDTYIEYRKESGKHDSVLICFSNKSANHYNREIRAALYGGDIPVCNRDILMIASNNYRLNRMNGEFVPVLSVGDRVHQSAPVYVQEGDGRKRKDIALNFVRVIVPDGNGNPVPCMLLEDLLTSDQSGLSVDENKALYINFRMRNPHLRPGSEAFAKALREDEYFNALRAKYGYAVTGHKCQGGEWGKVFVDYSGRTGLDDDSLRWAYTATTRARNTLYVTNFPQITPYCKFRIEPIQKCKNINPECRVFKEVGSTPFHVESVELGVRAKYWCIAKNMANSPYRIVNVMSRPYLEIYMIQTPDGMERYDLHYKTGGIFKPAKSVAESQHSASIRRLLDNEEEMDVSFRYKPSDDSAKHLFDTVLSACDTVNIQLTNVVEHKEDYSIVFYMRTCGTFSYIKIYIDSKGFVTYAKPMSMLGQNDNDLSRVVEIINSHFI